ncbi:MAG: triphosphoribosyl-dephospho-CoA synthase, partial [Clostridia bacterium]|nr:triphosphoribosyl-dephospho-CoA synthase [Clostridia bacterium]
LVSTFESERIRITDLRLVLEKTGAEALIAADGDAERIKSICIAIEESSPENRLLDIDVIANGHKLSRSKPRKCLICGTDAAVCARSRAHSVAALQRKTAELLSSPVTKLAAVTAEYALIREVNITPKPGLVDRNNNGANTDMDLAMFERSAKALAPFFERMAAAAIESREDCPLFVKEAENIASLETKLRAIGLEAEKAMLSATEGVNTHRGAIWTIGLLCCAYARILASHYIIIEEKAAQSGLGPSTGSVPEAILREAAKLAALLGDGTDELSKGAAARRKYGVHGPVEQALSGFPHAALALKTQQPYKQKILAAIRSKTALPGIDPWVYALLAVMAALDDNNALRRGGEEGAAFVKKRAGELLRSADSDPCAQMKTLLEFDRELIDRNISCGGAADMLAAAIFLESAELDLTDGSRRFVLELAERFADSSEK